MITAVMAKRQIATVHAHAIVVATLIVAQELKTLVVNLKEAFASFFYALIYPFFKPFLYL